MTKPNHVTDREGEIEDTLKSPNLEDESAAKIKSPKSKSKLFNRSRAKMEGIAKSPHLGVWTPAPSNWRTQEQDPPSNWNRQILIQNIADAWDPPNVNTATSNKAISNGEDESCLMNRRSTKLSDRGLQITRVTYSFS